MSKISTPLDWRGDRGITHETQVHDQRPYDHDRRQEHGIHDEPDQPTDHAHRPITRYTQRRPSAGPAFFSRTEDEGDLQAIPPDLGLGFEQRP